jgi:hypothetical protein
MARIMRAGTRNASLTELPRSYRPKVDFLVAALAAAGEAPADLRYADFGAGSGYLVAAFGPRASTAPGPGVSPAQVEFANGMIGEAAVQRISLDGTCRRHARWTPRWYP